MKLVNKSKRVLAMLVCALLVVLSVVPTMADTTKKLTIEKTVQGHTYSVYQLLTGDVSALNDGVGTLANVKAGSSLVTGKTAEDVYTAVKDKTDGALGDAAFALVNASKAAITISGNGADQSVDVEEGYYVVSDSYTGDSKKDGTDTISRYMVAVVGDTTMKLKTSTPTIDKKIIDNDANQAIDGAPSKTDTASIGDEIEYEVTGKVPNTEGYKYYYYNLNDTLSKGLTLKEDSFVVTIGTKELTKDTDYKVYVTKNADGTTSFILALQDLKTLVDTADNGISVGSEISVKYNATVNDSAVIGTDPNTNTVHLSYSNNPSSSNRNDKDSDHPGVPKPDTAIGEGPDRITKTYVTELVLLKVDGDGKKLTGAKFRLSGENLTYVIVDTDSTFREAQEGETAEYYKLKNGTYTKTAPSSAAEGDDGYNADKYEDLTLKYIRKTTTTVSTPGTVSGSEYYVEATVNEEGYLVFTGLNVGEYTLTEIETPKGYNTISPIEFTVTATQNGGTEYVGGNITWKSDNSAIAVDKNKGILYTTVVNLKGNTLPSTGGIGTRIFYIIGGLLMAAAAVVLITKVRFNKNK